MSTQGGDRQPSSTGASPLIVPSGVQPAIDAGFIDKPGWRALY
jgi:hypothetical protein